MATTKNFRINTRKLRLSALLTISLILVAACASYPPLERASSVDAERFKGSWYVIANIPYFAERNKVASKTTYRHRKGNLYDDIFEARDGSFDKEPKKIVGKVKSLNNDNTVWRSTFYWIFRFKFSVVHMDPDHQMMLLGHESRKYGWVMARSKQIADEDYKRALKIFDERGYNTDLFSKVPQLPEQLGQPGFQSSEE